MLTLNSAMNKIDELKVFGDFKFKFYCNIQLLFSY